MKQAKIKQEYKGCDRNMYKSLDIILDWIPNYLGITFVTLLVFLTGCFVRGDWILVLIHSIRQNEKTGNLNNSTEREDPFYGWTLKAMKLENISLFIITKLIFILTIHFAICGFMQWYFYTRQRDTSHEWKSQPDKFLTPELQRHTIIWGSINLAIGATLSAFMSCYIHNGGTTAIYFSLNECGWIWFFASIPIHFIYQEAAHYYLHRILHTRFFYTHIHKWHHSYKQPIAFSAIAAHPIEFIILEFGANLPVFIMPLNAGIYFITLLYVYYYGLINHSGIDIKPFWPWQMRASYHDNHHQYSHVNFGLNTAIFDRLHGTIRKKDHVYNEQIFGGRGIDLKKATDNLKKEHAEELAAEIKRKKDLTIKPKF